MGLMSPRPAKAAALNRGGPSMQEPRLYLRKSHVRTLKSGKTTIVPQCWVSAPRKGSNKLAKRIRRHCPKCGAAIISIRMPNGGVVHSEPGLGSSLIKHACLHVGDGLSSSRDDKTGDLFDTEEGGEP